MSIKRVIRPQAVESLINAARKVADSLSLRVIILMTNAPYDFREIQKILRKLKLIVASDQEKIHQATEDDEVQLIKLLHEPGTRQDQLGQAVVEGIADELFNSGETIIALYAGYDREEIDTLSVIPLDEQLSRLTARDLQRLETQVPLDTLRLVVDLACDIGREGREGKSIGTMFVVGDHRKVIQKSHEQVHDPFKGYNRKDCQLRNPRVRESIKELAQIDGAFIVASDGTVEAAGRILDAPAEGLMLSKGLGSRHWAAAAISKATKAIAIAVSESTGTVRLFQNGMVVLRIEPMDRAMKWREETTEPPASSSD